MTPTVAIPAAAPMKAPAMIPLTPKVAQPNVAAPPTIAPPTTALSAVTEPLVICTIAINNNF